MREDDATAVASPRTLNANVRVTLVFVFMLSASMSLYSTTTLASYIFLVTGSNAKVGFATGIQGVTNLALAIPASILGDRARRTSVLRGAAGLGLVASAFMAWCITWVAAARRSAGVRASSGLELRPRAVSSTAETWDTVESMDARRAGLVEAHPRPRRTSRTQPCSGR